jgi:multimeric flavodoxin WrbA
MKKIVIINGSMRKKSTYKLLKIIETYLKEYQITFLNIKDFDLKPCIGCENCMRNGGCTIQDDGQKVLDAISGSDGIIIGSPVYLRQISGYLKVLFDRACVWYHRSPLVSKPIFFVTTSQVTGSKAAIKYLKDLSVQWGTIDTGHISRIMFNLDKALDKKELDDFLYYMKDENKRNYKPSLKQIFEFNTQKVLALSVLPLDKAYWLEKGYANQNYFYDCKINIVKGLIGKAYFKMLDHFINKKKSSGEK